MTCGSAVHPDVTSFTPARHPHDHVDIFRRSVVPMIFARNRKGTGLTVLKEFCVLDIFKPPASTGRAFIVIYGLRLHFHPV